MKAKELYQVLSYFCKPSFGGVWSVDTFQECHLKNKLYIVNTDRRNGPGIHWVAVYFPKNGHPEYFDSFGRPPIRSCVRVMTEHTDHYVYNTRQLQPLTSDTCGHFCVLYATLRCSNFKLDSIIDLFQDPTYNHVLVTQNYDHLVNLIK